MSIWLSCSYCSISFQFLCWCFQFPSFMPCALLSIAWSLNQQKCKILYRWLDESVNCTGSRPAGSLGTSTLYLYVTVACHWLSPCLVSLSRVQSLLYLIKVQRLRVFYVTATRHLGLLNRGFTANSAKRMAAAPEKVFVALPAEFKVGRSSLSWVLSHFGGSGATIVITHVHAPPQMIPVSTCFLILYAFSSFCCWRNSQILVRWFWPQEFEAIGHHVDHDKLWANVSCSLLTSPIPIRETCQMQNYTSIISD